jgi:hypothetical protein
MRPFRRSSWEEWAPPPARDLPEHAANSGESYCPFGGIVALLPLAWCRYLCALATANAYRVSTTEAAFRYCPPVSVPRVEFTVDGVKCRGTSMLCAQQVSDAAGLVRFTACSRTYAATIEHDSARTSRDEARIQIGEPVSYEDGGRRGFRAAAVPGCGDEPERPGRGRACGPRPTRR